MKTKTDSSQVILFILCTLAYTCAYLSRDTFSATIPNIISITGATKTQMGTISTIFLIFYGGGQIMSGFLGDRFKANRLIVIGLLSSALCNFMFAQSTNFIMMSLFWGLNGISLSLLWAPIVKLLSTRLDDKYRYKFMVNISLSMPAGTLIAFFMSAFFIKNYNYKTSFCVISVIIAIIFAVFLIVYSKIKKHLPTLEAEASDEVSKDNKPVSFSKLFIMTGMMFIILAVMFNGIIRNGVSIWVPTYLTEAFQMEASASVLVSTIIPIVNMAGIYIASFFVKKTKNEALATTIMFFISLILLITLVFLRNASPFIAVILLALTSSSMQGANAIILSLMPLYFRKYNIVSTITGCLNANSYLAASVGSFATGILATNYGWNATIYFWLAMSALGIVVTLCYTKKWKDFIYTNK